jgi:hypothetical protein
MIEASRIKAEVKALARECAPEAIWTLLANEEAPSAF